MALCLIFAVQLLVSVRQLSPTYDEANHLYSGYRYWECKDFVFNPEHPPLAKLIAAAPLLAMNLNDPLHNCGATEPGPDFEMGRRFLYANDVDAVLFRARAAASLLALGLCVTVWFAARRMFGFDAALLATLLTVFEPNLLAHGALVTTDMAVTFALLFTTYVFYRYVEQPTPEWLLLAGVGTGLTFAAKISGIVVIPILIVVGSGDALLISGGNWRQRARNCARNLAAVLLMCVMGAVVLWATYGFRFAGRPYGLEMRQLAVLVGAHGAVPTKIVPAVLRARLLPESYLEGLQKITAISERGRPMFLLGKVYPRGQWFYFPVASLIKYTAPALLLIVLAAFAISFWRTHRRECWFLLVPPAVFLIISLPSGFNIGFRHALPMIPPLLIFAAAGALYFARRHRWALYAVGIAVVFHVASSLHAFPNYLCYANEFWGGPANTYKYLTDSNTDWGQAIKQVKHHIRKDANAPCWFTDNVFSDVRYYGLPCEPFLGSVVTPIPTHVRGTLVVSSYFVAGMSDEYGINPAAPVRGLTPKDKIGGSALLVYEGDFDTRLAAGVSNTMLSRRMMSEGRFLDSLRYARTAVEIVPESGLAHYQLCQAYFVLGEYEPGRQACERARDLLMKNAEYNHDALGTVRMILGEER